MAKEIILSNGMITLVSDIDFDLDQFYWRPRGRGSPYACRGNAKNSVVMHMVIIERMGLVIPNGHEVEHIDINSLNNQRENLRVVSKSVNKHNTHMQHNNTSGCRGVRYSKNENKYVVYIGIDGYRRHLGYFTNFDDAVAARKAAEKRFLNG